MSQQSALDTVRLSQTRADRHDTRKELVGHVDFVLNHPDFGVNEINSFSDGVKAAKNILVYKSEERMIEKKERKRKRNTDDVNKKEIAPMMAWMSSVGRVDFFVIHEFILKNEIKELRNSLHQLINEMNNEKGGEHMKQSIMLFMNGDINGRLNVTMEPIILDKQQLLMLECKIRELILDWFKQKKGLGQTDKIQKKMTWAAKTGRRGPKEKLKKGCAG